jgi:hypothetical protein
MGFRGLTLVGRQSHPSLPPTTLLPPPSLSSPAPLPHCLPTVQFSVQQPVKRKAPLPASLPSKRGSFNPAQLPSDLGELIACDTALLQRLGWPGLVAHRRPSSNFASLDNLHHPAPCLLRLYTHRGAPVKFAMPLWNCQHLQCALSQGPHCSSLEYIDFHQEEFVNMINKGQWVILLAKAVLHLPGLQLSPPGVVPQCGRHPRWICDYSWWGVNEDTLPLAAMEAMQFGRSLERILREILFANPAHGPV